MKSASEYNLLVCHTTIGRLRVRLPFSRVSIAWARAFEGHLSRDSRVKSTSVRTSTGSVIVHFDPEELSHKELLALIQVSLADLDGSGVVDAKSPYQDGRLITRPESASSPVFAFVRLVFLTALTLYHLVRSFVFKSPLSSGLLTVGTILGGLPLFRRALSDMIRGNLLSANTFLSGAALLATGMGESAAALEVIWIREIGQFLEDYIQDRSERAIREVMLVTPKSAFVLVQGTEVETPVMSIRVGDVLVVRTFDKIPVDGAVIHGQALVDESHITGHAEPAIRSIGDRVFAGTTVEEGFLRIEAEMVGEETYLSQVVRTVEESLAKRAPVEHRADKLAARLTVLGISVSVATFVFTRSLTKTLSVQLALTSPCATVLAASTAISAALAGAARNQVLIKGGSYLERFASIDCICFDKTGTLTSDLPTVVEVIPRNTSIRQERVLSMAAAAQCHNTHPIARALAKSVSLEEHITVIATDCRTVLGRGVRTQLGEDFVTVGSLAFMQEEGVGVTYFRNAAARLEKSGCTTIYVARNGKAQGLIGLRYNVGPRLAEVLQALQQDGVSELHLISGDSNDVVTRVARSLKLTSSKGGMLPGDKSKYVAELEAAGRIVGMVGDGINDAPALAQANIGIAVGAGRVEAALEAADVALVDSKLERIVFVRHLSRETLRVIEQNHWFAIVTDLIGAVLAIAGILPPVLSGAAHIGHTLVIFANSSRLLSYRPALTLEENHRTEAVFPSYRGDSGCSNSIEKLNHEK